MNISKLAGARTDINNPLFSGELQDMVENQPFAFFEKFIPSLVTLALIIGALVFFFMLIMGAIQWISSSGDKGTIEIARNKIMHALIGLVILFSVWALIQIIETFFGINILKLNLEVLKII